jgi:predicted flap endonuclease-1-like 5' DNA nuclease
MANTIAEVVAEAGRATLAQMAERNAKLGIGQPAQAVETEVESKPETATEVAAEVPAAAEATAETATPETATTEPAAEVAPEASPAEAQPAPAEEKAMAFKAVCVDDQGVIIGIGASIAVDRQDEAVTKAALIGMAYDFCASSDRAFRYNHDAKANVDAELVASWPGAPVLKSGKILAPGEDVPADDPVVAINIEKGKETHWFIGVKPNDPQVLEAARKGEIVGFSWGGFAQKVTA